MASGDIYSEHAGLGRPLAWSAGLHVAFSVFVVLYAVYIDGSFNGILPDFLQHRPTPVDQRLRNAPVGRQTAQTRTEAPCAFAPLTSTGVLHDAL